MNRAFLSNLSVNLIAFCNTPTPKKTQKNNENNWEKN